MLDDKIKKEWRAVAVLAGTTIGAGMFGLPFVFSKLGFFPTLFYLLGLGAVMALLNLIYGEVILRTPGDHQISGYLRLYLNDNTELLGAVNTFSFFVSAYGALLAYGIKIGEFLQMILGFGSPILFSVLFYLFACAAFYSGLRSISLLELLITGLVVFSIIIFFIFSIGKFDLTHLTGFSPLYLMLPYGVIFFALNGTSVVPEMEEILRKNPEKLKKSIVVGTLIPIFVYLVFSFVIVGNCGPFTSEDALSCLFPLFPNWIVKLGALIGILAMASSFLTLAYVLRESWFRDFKFSKTAAFLLVILPPFLLYLLGVRNFIRILDFSGAISVGLFGSLILFMHQKSRIKGKREPAYSIFLPRFIRIFLYILFIAGALTPFLTKVY